MRPVELNMPRTCIHFAMQMLPFKQWQCFPKMYHKRSNDAFRLSANQATSSIGFQELGSNSLHGETIARKEKKNSDEDEWCVKYKLTQLFLVSVWVVVSFYRLLKELYISFAWSSGNNSNHIIPTTYILMTLHTELPRTSNNIKSSQSLNDTFMHTPYSIKY